LRYRYLEKENILSFGKYPLVSLLDAREKRDNAKRLLIGGINPPTKRKEEKIAAITEARTTFGLIAEEYVKRMEEQEAAAATVTKTKWLLEDLASLMAKRPIKEITPAEILQLLQKIFNVPRLRLRYRHTAQPASDRCGNRFVDEGRKILRQRFFDPCNRIACACGYFFDCIRDKCFR
jgi:hypothetical protein